MKQHGYNGAHIDSLVIDQVQVQDFTQAELRVFLMACRDKNGLFLTGDTAQTIARGVGFRFQDVKTTASMFYHYNEALPEKMPPVGIPKVDHLTVNYRTHSGILNCAASIVEIMGRLFPETVDTDVPRESSFLWATPLSLASLQHGRALVPVGECGSRQEDHHRVWSSPGDSCPRSSREGEAS